MEWNPFKKPQKPAPPLNFSGDEKPKPEHAQELSETPVAVEVAEQPIVEAQSVPVETVRKSEAQIQLEDLRDTRGKLQFVKESLGYEREGLRHAQGDQYKAEDNLSSASKALIEKGVTSEGSLTDEDRAEFNQALREKETTDEGVEMYTATPTLDYEAGKLKNKVLAEKLKSLGVDLEDTSTPHSLTTTPAEAAINRRLNALDREINAKRLEIPGGKEQMIAETIKSERVLSDARMESVDKTLADVRGIPDTHPTISRVFDTVYIDTHAMHRYPLEVQEGVMGYVLDKAIEQRGGGNSEEIRNELGEYLRLKEEYDARLSTRHLQAREIEKVRGVRAALASELLLLKEHISDDTFTIAAVGSEISIHSTTGIESNDHWFKELPPDLVEELKGRKQITTEELRGLFNKEVEDRDKKIEDDAEEEQEIRRLQSRMQQVGAQRFDDGYHVRKSR